MDPDGYEIPAEVLRRCVMTNRNYQVVRMYIGGRKTIIKTGLTREEAVSHCKDPETSGSTCSDLKTRAAGLMALRRCHLKR